MKSVPLQITGPIMAALYGVVDLVLEKDLILMSSSLSKERKRSSSRGFKRRLYGGTRI